MYCKTSYCVWAQIISFYCALLCLISVLTRCVSGPMPVVTCVADVVNIIFGAYLWHIILYGGEKYYYKALIKYVHRFTKYIHRK